MKLAQKTGSWQSGPLYVGPCFNRQQPNAAFLGVWPGDEIQKISVGPCQQWRMWLMQIVADDGRQGDVEESARLNRSSFPHLSLFDMYGTVTEASPPHSVPLFCLSGSINHTSSTTTPGGSRLLSIIDFFQKIPLMRPRRKPSTLTIRSPAEANQIASRYLCKHFPTSDDFHPWIFLLMQVRFISFSR